MSMEPNYCADNEADCTCRREIGEVVCEREPKTRAVKSTVLAFPAATPAHAEQDPNRFGGPKQHNPSWTHAPNSIPKRFSTGRLLDLAKRLGIPHTTDDNRFGQIVLVLTAAQLEEYAACISIGDL